VAWAASPPADRQVEAGTIAVRVGLESGAGDRPVRGAGLDDGVVQSLETIPARIESGSAADIDRWARWVLDAKSLDEVLSDDA